MIIFKKHLHEWWGLFRLYYYRGNNLANFIKDLFDAVVIVGILKIAFNFPEETIYIVPLVPLTFVLLAWIDKKRGTWKWEAEYSSRHLNPFMAKLEKDIEEIKRKVNENK